MYCHQWGSFVQRIKGGCRLSFTAVGVLPHVQEIGTKYQCSVCVG